MIKTNITPTPFRPVNDFTWSYALSMLLDHVQVELDYHDSVNDHSIVVNSILWASEGITWDRRDVISSYTYTDTVVTSELRWSFQLALTMWSIPLRVKYLVWAITGTRTLLIKRTQLTIKHLACCCQGFLLQGYDQGVMSGIVCFFQAITPSPSNPPIDRSRQPIWKGFQPS